MKTEIWQPVKGYENYEISNLGRVKSLKYGRDRIMKPMKDGGGYLQVGLYKDGKRKILSVHRLVATAFIPNPLELPEINHRNEDKTNNCVSNIEWCSAKYNSNYGSRNKRSAAARINHPDRSKAVEASRFSDFREICLRFPSTAEAGRNGYKFQCVAACCRGCYCSKGNFYKNLYWRFADESGYNIMQERQILIFMNVINNFKEKCLI